MELSQTQINSINTNTKDILEFLDDIKETISNAQYISIANKLKKIYDIVNCDYYSENDEDSNDESDDDTLETQYTFENDSNDESDDEESDDNESDDDIYTLDYLDKYNSLVEKVPEHLRNTKYNIYNNRDIFKIRDCYCCLGEVCEYENNNYIYCSNYINFLLEHPLMIILELYISKEPKTEENVKLYLNEYNLYFGHKYNEDYYSFNSVGNQYCRIKAIKTMKVYLHTCELIHSIYYNTKISKAIIGFYGIYSMLSNYCKKFLIDEKKFNFTCYNKLNEFYNSDDIESIKEAGEYINLPPNTLNKALTNYYNFIIEDNNIMDVLGNFIE